MESAKEISEITSGAVSEEITPPSFIKDPDAFKNLDWSPIEEINEKFPVGANATVKAGLRLLLVVDRFGSFLSATVFCVFLPLLPTILCVAKSGSLSRETLIITSSMQVLSYLNNEHKSGGIAVFIGYTLGFGFCALVQNWSLNPVIAVSSWSSLLQHACQFFPLVNGHVLDCFLLWSIFCTGILNCFSVFKTYAVGFKEHWFWAEVKKLSKSKEEPKALEEKKS